MLQVASIRENKNSIIQKLKKRNLDATALIEEAINLDQNKRSTQTELDNNLSEANQIAKQIGVLFKEGKNEEANNLKTRSGELKEINKLLQEKLNSFALQLRKVLSDIPNVPHDLVPNGNSEQDNEIVYEHGSIPQLGNHSVPHWELAKEFDLIDFELGTKITGAGFPVYKGKGARLQRALINFFLNEAIAAGYTEIQPPLVVNEDSGFGTGQLPDKEGQMYYVGADNLYLIPTAEVPITNLYRNILLKPEDLPITNVGYTPCFRREAGSYGKDVRGLNRLHQFDKVEIVHVVEPDQSYAHLDSMVEYVRGLLEKLELPYRVARLCGGDLGFTAALTYDMEVYSAAQKRWLEVSSISNFEAFQAHRLKLRYKKDGKTQLAHTLNGSALALPRILAALLENNQTDSGIKIPAALHQYTGFEIIN